MVPHSARRTCTQILSCIEQLLVLSQVALTLTAAEHDLYQPPLALRAACILFICVSGPNPQAHQKRRRRTLIDARGATGTIVAGGLGRQFHRTGDKECPVDARLEQVAPNWEGGGREEDEEEVRKHCIDRTVASTEDWEGAVKLREGGWQSWRLCWRRRGW